MCLSLHNFGVFPFTFKRDIHCFGTVKLNRVPGISSVILPDNELIARGKSSFVEYEGTLKDKEGKLPANETQHIRLIRWYDNKWFNLMSSVGSAQPPGVVRSWDRTSGHQVNVSVECLGLVQY